VSSTDRPAQIAVALTYALAAMFVALGALFLFAPHWGAGLFGIPAPENAGFAYLPAIGLRDLAFGLYLAALARLGSARALSAVLALTTLIPLGDMALVGWARGLDSGFHLLLHGASAALMAGSAIFVRAVSSKNTRE
jgi:hypothetical protein